MRKSFFFILLLFSVFQLSALSGRWKIDVTVSQSISSDQVFYADSSSPPFIQEIFFRSNGIVELLLSKNINEKARWISAAYTETDDFVNFDIPGFGRLHVFVNRILRDTLLFSYTVYISDNGLIAVPEPEESEEVPEEPVLQQENSLLGNGAERLDSIVPASSAAGTKNKNRNNEADDSVLTGSESGDGAAPEESAEEKRQLLVISTFFKKAK